MIGNLKESMEDNSRIAKLGRNCLNIYIDKEG